MRENYFEILKELENNKGEHYYNERSDNLKIGICEKNILIFIVI